MKPDQLSHKIVTSSGKYIYVLKPSIDKLTLTITGNLAIKCMAKSAKKEWEPIAANYWNGFYKRVIEEVHWSSEKIEQINQPSPHYKTSIKLKLYGNRYVLLQTNPRSSSTAPLRLEFNPSRLQLEDFDTINEIYSLIDYDNFPLPALMGDARVTRLDIAVDLIDIDHQDIMIYNKDVWKWWSYGGNDEGTQTTNFYSSKVSSKSPYLNPKRRADLIIYDKKAQQKANGEDPRFGDRSHTRIELCLNKKSFLTNLPKLEFPFQNWSVSRMNVDEPPFESGLWKLVLDSARYRGINKAYALLPESVTNGVQLDRKKHLPEDLITKSKTWSHWPDVLNNQLGTILEWANTDPGYFLPDTTVL